LAGSLSLLDWRRRTTALYRQVRGTADPHGAHDLWVDTRNELLASHPESPVPPTARPTFAGVEVAPYDAGLRFQLEVDPDVSPLRLSVATGTDGTVVLERIGVLHLPALGDLDVWWVATYGGGLFVPVKDGLAGAGTYGGGRYLIDTVKGADLGGEGRWLVVDLNFAYNPSCAYDPAWACPLAPAGNVLASPLWAGELSGPPAAPSASP